jgi:hypothetical protein
MHSAWQADASFGDSEHYDDPPGYNHVRGSLGQFIERSTSAPLPSSGDESRKSAHGDLLVGNVSEARSVVFLREAFLTEVLCFFVTL